MKLDKEFPYLLHTHYRESYSVYKNKVMEDKQVTQY